MTEQTAVVVDSDGPNANGWYEVEFEDGTKASTKSEELARAAFQSRGTESTVVITEKTSGKFTNRYLNQLNDIKDSGFKGKRSSGSSAPASAPKDSERIARQWAYGRAIELLRDSDTEYSFPPNSEMMGKISTVAMQLLNATRE